MSETADLNEKRLDKKRHEFRLDYLFTYRLTMPVGDPPIIIGEVNEGFALVLTERGSTVTGPRINGRFTPESQDYVTIGRNGISTHKVRSVLITEDGAQISFIYEGRGDFGENGYADFLSGKPAEPFRIRSSPYLQTAHPDYLWVNRLQCINIGEVYASKGYGTFDVYAVI